MYESLKVLVVILPVVLAGIVHSAAIRFDWLPQLAKRLDFGVCLGGRPLLGANKTFRGPIIMIVVSAASAWALSFGLSAGWLPQGFGFMSQPERAVWLGAVMGLGYALGELPNSFVKRRLGIAPGDSTGGIAGIFCYVVDQVDSVIGVVALLWWIYAPPSTMLLALLAAGSVVHIVFDQCLYAVGVKHRESATIFPMSNNGLKPKHKHAELVAACDEFAAPSTPSVRGGAASSGCFRTTVTGKRMSASEPNSSSRPERNI